MLPHSLLWIQQQPPNWFLQLLWPPLKLLFLQRMYIGSYQPLPHLKTNNIPRFKILQRFSFVLRVRKQTLITACRAGLSPPASSHSLHPSPSLSSKRTYLPSGSSRGQVPSYSHRSLYLEQSSPYFLSCELCSIFWYQLNYHLLWEVFLCQHHLFISF